MTDIGVENVNYLFCHPHAGEDRILAFARMTWGRENDGENLSLKFFRSAG